MRVMTVWPMRRRWSTPVRWICRPAIIDWVRAGCSEDAPATGYNSLVALAGPVSLTRRQTQRVRDALRGHPTEIVSINIRITKITGQLPNPTESRVAARAIQGTAAGCS
jgi:hypothetical protein